MAIAQPPKRPLARKRARAHTPAPPTAQPPRQTKPPSGTPTHASSPHTSNASKNTHPWRNASNSPAPHGSASNSNATAPSSTHKSTHHRATTYSTKPPYKPLAAPNRSHHFPHKSPPKPEKSASPTNSHSATNSPVEALFLGLRLLAAYCPPYGSAAVLLPLRNTHVLACYVLGSRLAPTTCEHTHAFFGATPQCALPILVLAHKAPPKPKNAAFRDAARRWRTKYPKNKKCGISPGEVKCRWGCDNSKLSQGGRHYVARSKLGVNNIFNS